MGKKLKYWFNCYSKNVLQLLSHRSIFGNFFFATSASLQIRYGIASTRLPCHLNTSLYILQGWNKSFATTLILSNNVIHVHARHGRVFRDDRTKTNFQLSPNINFDTTLMCIPLFYYTFFVKYISWLAVKAKQASRVNYVYKSAWPVPQEANMYLALQLVINEQLRKSEQYFSKKYFKDLSIMSTISLKKELHCNQLYLI